ncbi:hypothetical protein K6U06_17985 [Acidiferrimicrobium sp. IK]|uniref:hypothetical protein n=1 Tax=Acidiferrimicrobium sp. IK TaxID=2871700 RepID=UPI0021CB29F7|nr:hypothetical protein [Acidiferrimicrobium sp. IK]MCU4186261.1 hypothetical protein [Acidiferrimicrobium sp. IK]
MITPERPQPAPARHPSFPDREPVGMRRRSAPVTCCACDIAYLDPPFLATVAPPGTWVCPRCSDEPTPTAGPVPAPDQDS